MNTKRTSLAVVTVMLVTAFFMLVQLNWKLDLVLPQPCLVRHSTDTLRQLWQRVSQQNVFQVVNHNFTATYVYSAYFDDRPAPDVTSWWKTATPVSVVRVFAWFQRYENSPLDSNQRWRCIFFNDEFEMIGNVPVSDFTDTNSFDIDSKLVRAMLLCPYDAEDCTSRHASISNSWLTRNCNRRAPRTVSIKISQCEDSINLIKIIDLPTERNRSLSTKIASKIAPLNQSRVREHNSRPSPKYQVSIAVCVRPLFGTSITVYDIVEFIEVNRVFGAQLFFFYVDDSVDEKVRRCLEYYERLGVVETAAWRMPPDLDREAPEKGQYFAMTECQYRLMYRTKYLVIVDLDEFIVPARTANWLSMLALIHNGSKCRNGDRIASYSIRNRFFPMENPDFDPPLQYGIEDSNHLTNWTRTFKTLTKIMGKVYLYPWKDRSKIIAPPERVLVWHTHEILGRHVVPPGESNCQVNEEDAVLHHYRREVMNNQTSHNYTRMWHFGHKIIPRLERRLKLIQSLNLQ